MQTPHDVTGEGESAEVDLNREGRDSNRAVRRRLGAADAALPEEDDGRRVVAEDRCGSAPKPAPGVVVKRSYKLSFGSSRSLEGRSGKADTAAAANRKIRLWSRAAASI